MSKILSKGEIEKLSTELTNEMAKDVWGNEFDAEYWKEEAKRFENDAEYWRSRAEVKELTREDRLKLSGTLKWAEDLLREAGHDEAVDEVQDCLMILRKAQEK